MLCLTHVTGSQGTNVSPKLSLHAWELASVLVICSLILTPLPLGKISYESPCLGCSDQSFEMGKTHFENHFRELSFVYLLLGHFLIVHFQEIQITSFPLVEHYYFYEN